MNKNISILNILIILSIFLPLVTFADVTKIDFVTDPRVVDKNTLSDAITIQTQDSGSNQVQTTETIDLVFTSTSPTGEFLNSSGNAVTKFMSTNTANKTFYYKDSTEGTFTITVKGTGRTSLKEWEARQQIIVGSGGEVLGTNTESSNENNSNNSTPTSSSVGSGARISTPNGQLEVSIGNDRITNPGNIIYFQAVLKKNLNINSQIEFNWSYGDGNVGVGQSVNHVYKYPGDYVVVLNARSGDTFSVSRIKVKVIESQISLKNGDGYIDIINNGNSEVNLFNWKIEENGIGFIFQPDTIILPNSTLRLDKSLLKMKGDRSLKELSLTNFAGQKLVSIVDNKEGFKSIENIKKELALIESKVNDVKPKLSKNIQTDKLVMPKNEVVLDAKSDKKDDDVLVDVASPVLYEADKNPSIFVRVWGFVRGVFSQ